MAEVKKGVSHLIGPVGRHGWPTGLGLVVVAAAGLATGGCAAPAQESEQVTFGWTVELDAPCGQIAGSLALFELLEIEIQSDDDPDFVEWMTAELERRCPPDTKPEAFDFTVYIPSSACEELKGLLKLASFFDTGLFVSSSRRAMVDDLIADLEDEVARRCASTLNPG
jgi:hypothetical protein